MPLRITDAGDLTEPDHIRPKSCLQFAEVFAERGVLRPLGLILAGVATLELVQAGMPPGQEGGEFEVEDIQRQFIHRVPFGGGGGVVSPSNGSR